MDGVAVLPNPSIDAGDLIDLNDGTEALLRPILSADWSLVPIPRPPLCEVYSDALFLSPHGFEPQ
jgi:hypothetical protein